MVGPNPQAQWHTELPASKLRQKKMLFPALGGHGSCQAGGRNNWTSNQPGRINSQGEGRDKGLRGRHLQDALREAGLRILRLTRVTTYKEQGPGLPFLVHKASNTTTFKHLWFSGKPEARGGGYGSLGVIPTLPLRISVTSGRWLYLSVSYFFMQWSW
jgi:hypothetical protein